MLWYRCDILLFGGKRGTFGRVLIQDASLFAIGHDQPAIVHHIAALEPTEQNNNEFC